MYFPMLPVMYKSIYALLPDVYAAYEGSLLCDSQSRRSQKHSCNHAGWSIEGTAYNERRQTQESCFQKTNKCLQFYSTSGADNGMTHYESEFAVW